MDGNAGPSLVNTHTHTEREKKRAHFLPSVDASTVKGVDVLSTLVHEPAYEPVVTEDDAGHLRDVLIALVLRDVATMIHQAGH